MTMNAIELYKRLPKKNCGRCSQKTCMPFALSVIKGDADLSECPLLIENEIRDLKGSITRADWQEELIQSLRLKIKDVDLSAITGDLGGDYRDGRLFMHCLGREFEIFPGGDIHAQSPITPWIRILLLHYINTHGKAGLSGKWVSFSELRSGMVKASSFLREVEDPIKELFESSPERVSAALIRLGAKQTDDFPTPNAWSLFLLPKVPVVILYWPGEDEFPATAKILFDQTADKFLDVESLMFLLEGFVKNIERVLSLDNTL
ncbi:MAG: DUF3786 domain-containing protein [Nitrospirae bacterium]|nr:DUF3786 domain-containing protein [Nitrospirota bacterium]